MNGESRAIFGDAQKMVAARMNLCLSLDLLTANSSL
jgi:hypothetical protein